MGKALCQRDPSSLLNHGNERTPFRGEERALSRSSFSLFSPTPATSFPAAMWLLHRFSRGNLVLVPLPLPMHARPLRASKMIQAALKTPLGSFPPPDRVFFRATAGRGFSFPPAPRCSVDYVLQNDLPWISSSF